MLLRPAHGRPTHWTRTERETGERLLSLGLLRVVECSEQLVSGRLHGFEPLLSLLPHFADERKAVRWSHLTDGVSINAFAGRLHRGRGVLDRLNVFGPSRLLSRGDAELDFKRFKPN